jgi:hypothetical protein
MLLEKVKKKLQYVELCFPPYKGVIVSQNSVYDPGKEILIMVEKYIFEVSLAIYNHILHKYTKNHNNQ